MTDAGLPFEQIAEIIRRERARAKAVRERCAYEPGSSFDAYSEGQIHAFTVALAYFCPDPHAD